VPDWLLLPIELILLEGGLIGSLLASHRIALTVISDEGRARRAFLPWAMLAVMLFALGVWLLLQPMEMRGTLRAG
jgi:hypothetical protein